MSLSGEALSARSQVLRDLERKIGFPFAESEMSPSLRRRVGELEVVYQEYWRTQGQCVQLKNGRESFFLLTIGMGIAGVIFIVFAAFIWPLALGIPLLIASFIMYTDVLKRKDAEMTALNAETSRLEATADAKRASLSDDIYSELSSEHVARASGHNLSSSVVKETIVKEVVMIPCSYCHALMPQTSVFCPNCSARRRG